MRIALIGLALAFGMGGCLGSNMTDQPPPEFIEVPRTKIVEQPAPPPVEVLIVPESCLRAMSYAESISRHADSMYAKGTEQLAIISEARKSLADGGDLAISENRQRRLQGRTVGHLFSVSEALIKFKSAHEECKEEAP